MDSKIKVTYEEINDPKVDEILSQESSFKMGMGSDTTTEEMEKASFIHESWFHLMLAGLIGAFTAWALIEPYLDDSKLAQGEPNFAILLLLSVGGLSGLMIGSMEGLLARNFRRTIKAGTMGFLIGFGGGLLSLWVAGIVTQIVVPIGIAIVGRKAAIHPADYFSGFMLNVVIRTLIWTILGMTVGLGPGIGLKSKKLVFNGFIGGMIGGAIGGMLFDPISYVFSGGTLKAGAEVSRAVGFCVLGGTAGLMIGLVELLTKDAWLLMTEGPLKGKQFVLYKNPTQLGSSPKCEIYLFKDPDIQPFHASIQKVRDGHIISDNNAQNEIIVNGQKIKRNRLKNGDQIQLGKVKLVYLQKDKKT